MPSDDTAAPSLPALAGMTPLPGLFDEARRQLSVCNACRYCAGYCPVWPELELRTVLSGGDLSYLANLCHDCQDCYTACMYTEPHEFALNPPRVFAGLRADSYRRYAWPGAAPGWLTGWRGVTAAFAAVALLLIGLGYATTGRLLSAGTGHGNPYQILPYPLLLVLLALPALWCAGILAAGAVRCWRDIHGPLADLTRRGSLGRWHRAVVQAVQLRHMRGGGAGCDYPGDAPSPARRLFHLILVYGFGLCVASTVSAAIEQDLAQVPPPYPYLSVPVVTGTLGGLGMLAGGAGLLALKSRADASRTPEGMRRSDYAFIAALLILAASGLLTLAVRDTPAFGPVLTAHLAAIEVAFAVAPYTKFAHWLYRLLAIYKNALSALLPRGAPPPFDPPNHVVVARRYEHRLAGRGPPRLADPAPGARSLRSLRRRGGYCPSRSRAGDGIARIGRPPAPAIRAISLAAPARGLLSVLIYPFICAYLSSQAGDFSQRKGGAGAGRRCTMRRTLRYPARAARRGQRRPARPDDDAWRGARDRADAGPAKGQPSGRG